MIISDNLHIVQASVWDDIEHIRDFMAVAKLEGRLEAVAVGIGSFAVTQDLLRAEFVIGEPKANRGIDIYPIVECIYKLIRGSGKLSCHTRGYYRYHIWISFNNFYCRILNN